MSHIYIDISNTYTTRAYTGIQRVVRELSGRLAKTDLSIKFLHFSKKEECFYRLTAPDIALDPDQVLPATPEDEFCLSEIGCGDIFIELDAAWGEPLDRYSLLSVLKQKGAIIVCMHYDAVPVLFPDFSHPNTVYRYTRYLAAHMDLADYFICISNTVKKDLETLSLKITNRGVNAFTLPLGADFKKNGGGLSPDQGNNGLIERILNKKFLLAVGTLEPRKNHKLLIEAFDLLDNTYPLNLVIIGKQGWNIEQFAQDIKTRPDFQDTVFWLENADDNQLQILYQHTFACINVAHYEGYGLPVIEALNHDCVTICSRGGALEEVGVGACHILAENTAECLADEIKILYNDRQHYEEYKKKAQGFNTPTWDDSCRNFLHILERIRKGEDFNWGFVPRQAVYISIDAEQLTLSTQSVVQNMDFITHFILLTPEKLRNDMTRVLEKTKKKFTIITDEEIYAKYEASAADFEDHVMRNIVLRTALFKDEAIDPNFISFDGDYLVQEKIDVDFFLDGQCHSAFYYSENMDQWLGTPDRPTSYDEGNWRTGAMLKACGYRRRIFSSHMPQIINKKMARQVYDRMVNENSYPMCEWSLYFNIFSHLYPARCRIKNYTALSWPCNPTDWLPSQLPNQCFFENYYKWNYEKNGRFYGMPALGHLTEKTNLWKIAFEGQLRQRRLNRQATGEDNPVVTLFDDRMEIDFTHLDIIENELVRIKLDNKTKYLEQAQVTIGIFNGKKTVVKTHADIFSTRWMPVKITNAATNLFLDVSLHDSKNKRRLDQKAIKLKFINQIDAPKQDEHENMRIKKTIQELMSEFDLLDDDQFFLRQAYQLILGRQASEDELQFLQYQLDTGVPRKIIISNLLLSPEHAQLNKKRVQLPWLEKKKLLMWKKWHALLSRIKAIQIFSQATAIQTQSFDRLVFNQNKEITSLGKEMSSLKKEVSCFNHQVEDIKSNIFFFLNQEAQAQQRRLDQFFFDVRQELRISKDPAVLDKVDAMSRHSIDNYYLSLEEAYRGSRDEILKRYKATVELVTPLFAKEKEIRAADLGCGRGEWLQIMANYCTTVTGIDMNSAMVSQCLSHGLNAEQDDLLAWLQQQPDLSLELISAFHVIEHLSFEKFNMLIHEIYRVLTHGGSVILETPNPENIHVATHMFYRDPTHKTPVPKELSSHLLKFHGFTQIKVYPVHPFEDTMRVPEDSEVAKRFNSMVYGATDYMITGTKLSVKK